MATESDWQAFREQTATEEQLRAILQEHEQELASNPALVDCPDFRAFMEPLLWQIERMDWQEADNGLRAPTMAEALAVLREVEAESL